MCGEEILSLPCSSVQRIPRFSRFVIQPVVELSFRSAEAEAICLFSVSAERRMAENAFPEAVKDDARSACLRSEPLLSNVPIPLPRLNLSQTKRAPLPDLRRRHTGRGGRHEHAVEAARRDECSSYNQN